MTSSLHKRIWLIAGPMILANLTVPILGLVDTAILGHLSHAHYLGAVALGAVIFDIMFWAFGFLRMGTTGLTAQAYGSNDLQKTRLLLWQSLLVAVSIGGVIILLQAPLFSAAFAYMSPSPEVEKWARIYCDIRIWAAPATLAHYVIYGWLLSIGKTRTVLALTIIANLINISLDYLFVMQFNMLTAGVAWGSLIAEYSLVILGLWVVRQSTRDMGNKSLQQQLLRVADYRQLFTVNRYIFIRTLCLLFTISFFYARSAQQDDITLSANAILMTLLMVFSYAQDGFANAAEVLSGRAIGARNLQTFKQINRGCALWCLYTSIFFTLSLIIFDKTIIGLLTDIDSVTQTTLNYWPWLILLPFAAAWSFLLDGIFVGATKARAMQNTMLFSSFCIFLPAWYLLTPWGNHGLWIAFLCFHAARSISMACVYYYYSKQQQWIYTAG
ncbi:DNA-damage-inducible protein F [gamma proteobacterium IMCC2047]|nr:DNA-damage-inducible protein F [gamma proteobacterium IMCC2047]